MEPMETSLEIARRHVQQGAQIVIRQTQIIEEMRARRQDVGEAESLLASQRQFLRLAREHVQIEEERLGADSPLLPAPTLHRAAAVKALASIEPLPGLKNSAPNPWSEKNPRCRARSGRFPSSPHGGDVTS